MTQLLFEKIALNQIPIALLLEADPDEKSIHCYPQNAWCFAAFNHNKLLGACVIKRLAKQTAELINISVFPAFQQQGIGSQLLKFAIASLANISVQKLELGTGTFGYQLVYYQRLGFRVDSVVKDHFLLNYAEPIFENGIQHKDMLRLSLSI